MFKFVGLFLLFCYFGNVSSEVKFSVEILENFKNCMTDPAVDFSEFKISVTDKNIQADGRLKITKVVAGPIKLMVKFEKKMEGVWQVQANETIPDACTLLENLREIRPIFQSLTAEQRKCPLAINEIQIKEAKFGTLEYISERDLGEYRWHVEAVGLVESKEEEVACVEGSVKIFQI